MEQMSNQLLLRNDHGVSKSRSTKNNTILSNRLPKNQCSVCSNLLPAVDSNVVYNRLPSNESSGSCKCKHYSGSFPEATSTPSDDKQNTNSRNDETRRKSVSFSLGSSLNLTEGQLCATDIKFDGDLETDSDLTIVNTESTSTGQRNGDSGSQNNSYTSRLANGSTHGNSTRNNNATFKRHRSAYSESDGNSIMPPHCKCIASDMNTATIFPIRGTLYNTYFRPDQRSVLQHQHSPGSPCSTINQGKHSFPQYLPCHCHPNFEVIRFRSHPNIYHEVDRNLDPRSSAPLLEDTCQIESHDPCATSQESRALPHEPQSSKTVARSAVSNNSNNKTVDEESAVSVPISCCTKKAIKTCLIMLVVFNIIFLAAIGFMISMLLNHHTYQECPLCKDVLDQIKRLKGGNINDSTIQDHLKENDKDGRCCLDHTFVFKLMAPTNPSNQALQQYPIPIDGNTINRIINSSEKAALHLQSLNGTIPLRPQPSDDGLRVQKIEMEMIKWNFGDKAKVMLGSSWETLDSDTKIKIPLTGVYYIYAMVQYRYKTVISTQPSDRIPNFEEFPLSISLYKIPLSETTYSRIGTVTQHCKFVSQSIEHNSIIERIVRLKKDDQVFLAVSNKQFLKDDQSRHQIGIFRVD